MCFCNETINDQCVKLPCICKIFYHYTCFCASLSVFATCPWCHVEFDLEAIINLSKNQKQDLREIQLKRNTKAQNEMEETEHLLLDQENLNNIFTGTVQWIETIEFLGNYLHANPELILIIITGMLGMRFS